MWSAFSGVGVALVTLFDAEGRLDVAATVAHAERMVDAGVRGVLVAGSTGEAPALEPDERTSLVGAVRAAVPTDVAVLAGTGAPSTRQALRLSVDAEAAGADALLVLSPPRVTDPARYYAAVSDAVDVAVLAYHFPAVSSPGVDVDALAALGVAGIKDSSGDPTRLLRTLRGFDGAVYTGSAPLALYAGALGATGAILALANVDPAGCVAAFAGDVDAQLALTDDHVAASTDFPHGLKGLLAERYGTSPATRMG